MSIAYKIKAEDLDQATLQAIKDRYGNANLVINVDADPPADLLSEEDFWNLIGLLDWRAMEEGADEENVISPLVDKLASGKIATIYQFADILSKKLWLLDTPEHARKLIELDGFLSVDDFLYVRCAVVANGKEFYEEVLGQPEELPAEATFSRLLSVAEQAFSKKTDQEMVYLPLHNYETYSNREALGK